MNAIRIRNLKKKIRIEFDYQFDWNFVAVCRELKIPWDAKEKIRYLNFTAATIPLSVDKFLLDYKKIFDYYSDIDKERFKTAFQFLIDKYTKTNIEEESYDLSKYPIDEYQKTAIEFLLNRGSAILADDMGLGKCLLPNTPVLTPDGWKEIQLLKIGDLVGNSQGTFSKVTGVYKNKPKKYYKFTFNDGSEIENCEKHLWQVQTANWQTRNSGWKVLETKEIIKNIYTKNHRNEKFFTWRFPIVKPFNFQKNKLQINPYILGCLLGDGYLRKNKIQLTSADKEIINSFEQKYELKKISKYDFKIKSKKLEERLKNLNLLGKHSWDKFIPEIYKWSSIKDRKEIIRGLMDTDGYVDKSGIVAQFTSISKQLIEDFKFIIQSLGGLVTQHEKIPTYTYKGKKLKGRLAYTLTLKLPSDFNPFKLSRKKKKFKSKSKYKPNRILTKVEYIGKKSGICISTDAPDHLYVINNFILTHNTRETSVYILEKKPKKVLIVTPLSVREVWRDELIFLGESEDDFCIVEKEIEKKKYTIINYDKLKKFRDILIKNNYDIIILDEAHRSKSKDSITFKCLKAIAKKCDNVVCVTGTPIMNKPAELFPLLHLIKHPLGTGFTAFADRYCDRKLVMFGPHGHWDVNGASNLNELADKIKDVMIRRLKKDVLEDIPDKEYHVYRINFNQRQQKFYEQIESEYKDYIKTERYIDRANHLAKITKLRQYCSEAKIPITEQHIKDALNNNEKILVFGFYIDPLNQMHSNYENSLMITGQTKKQDRAQIIKEFQENPYYKIFFGQIIAAGFGITLTAANKVVFNDVYWNPAIHEQSEDRANRRGAVLDTQIYYPLFKGSIEEDIYKLIKEKEKLINKIMDKTIDFYKPESMETELINLMKEKYGKRNE